MILIKQAAISLSDLFVDHLGIKKTLSKIRQSYYWPGLQNDVKAYVGGCDICARRKEPLKTKRAPMEIVKNWISNGTDSHRYIR